VRSWREISWSASRESSPAETVSLDSATRITGCALGSTRRRYGSFISVGSLSRTVAIESRISWAASIRFLSNSNTTTMVPTLSRA
jgi:hypothetical protein